MELYGGVLTRAVRVADATPLAVMRLNLFHRLHSVSLAVIADRLGNPAIVTDERGRTGYAAGQDERDHQRP